MENKETIAKDLPCLFGSADNTSRRVSNNLPSDEASTTAKLVAMTEKLGLHDIGAIALGLPPSAVVAGVQLKGDGFPAKLVGFVSSPVATAGIPLGAVGGTGLLSTSSATSALSNGIAGSSALLKGNSPEWSIGDQAKKNQQAEQGIKEHDLSPIGISSDTEKLKGYYAQSVMKQIKESGLVYAKDVTSLVNKLEKWAKNMPETDKNKVFSQTVVVGGINKKSSGHSYPLHVMYKDGFFHAFAFDSVGRIDPALKATLGVTFATVSASTKPFQHTAVGCREYSIEVGKALKTDPAYQTQLLQTVEQRLLDPQYRKSVSESLADLKCFGIFRQLFLSRRYVPTEAYGKPYEGPGAHDTEDGANVYPALVGGRVQKLVSTISAASNNIRREYFLWAGSCKEFGNIDFYSPKTTHLMGDYKTLRSHIDFYKDDKKNFDIIVDQLDKAKNKGYLEKYRRILPNKTIAKDESVHSTVEQILQKNKKIILGGYTRRALETAGIAKKGPSSPSL